MNFFGTFGTTDTEALQVLMPIVDRAMHAHQVGDYSEYSRVITSDLAEKVTEEGFRRAYQDLAPQFGTMQSRLFLASLRRGDNPILVFSAKFSATEDDILVSVTFRNGSQPPLIAWLWIE